MFHTTARKRYRTIAPAIALALGALVLAPTADARMRDLFGVPGTEVRPDGLIDRRERAQKSPAQAAREAQERYGGGRVLSVDPAGDGYRVKLLRDGDVRVVFISGR